MSEERDLNTAATALERRFRAILHSLAPSEPAARKCVCAGREIPFYCPAHGRVENPNWPLLERRES
jgi:hypothetical protein